jgi:aryl-alcohol dehydrogenase-like predicted oxidoreductase
MMPVNPVEGLLGGFLTETLAAARAKGVAVIAMKVLGASHHLNPALGITAERLIRYALAREVTLAIVGCSSPNEVKTLAEAALDPHPMTPEEIASLHDRFRPHYRKLAYYRGVG